MSAPTWWAAAAVRGAAALLPGRCLRRRYRQEFIAELAGLSPGAQARHATGVLTATWALRVAIAESLPIEQQEDDVSLIGRVLCCTGVHRWLHEHNPEDGAAYLECARCHRQKDTLSFFDYSNPNGGFGMPF